MCRLGNTSEPGSASEVLAGPGKGMGRAGHMNGEVAAAGSGSGNDPPLCYPARALGPRVGTAAIQAAVEVAASCRYQSAGASIISPAGFGWRLAPRGRLTAGSQPSIVGPMGEPPKPRPVRVAW